MPQKIKKVREILEGMDTVHTYLDGHKVYYGSKAKVNKALADLRACMKELVGKEMYKGKKFNIGNPDEYAQWKYSNGYNQRAREINKRIGEEFK